MNQLRVTVRRKRRGASGDGFTLVELLVVVTVMLLLISMTVMAIDFTFNAERVRSAARQVQSALEGARDRAIFAKEPRGLRFLVDPSEPRMVSSMVYVGAGMEWPINPGEELVTLQRADFNLDNVADAPEVMIVRGDPAICAWLALKERGYLPVYEDLNLNGQLDAGEDQNGNGVLDLDAPLITIPADGVRSYPVLTNYLQPTADGFNKLVFMPGTQFLEAPTTASDKVPAFDDNRRFTYKLTLPPRILPDAQPILLPEGIVIDMDGSRVPPDWYPGVPPAGPPTMPLDQQYAKPYSAQMDIMFSPRGVVFGPLAAQGLVHLYLAERKDVVFAVDQGITNSTYTGIGGVAIAPRRPPRFGTSPPGIVPPGNPPLNLPLVPGAGQFDPTEAPIGDRLLVTIFTQTGKVSTHKINATDSDNDGYADDPFQFATQGEGQSQ